VCFHDTVHIALDPEYPKPFMYIDNYLDGIDVVLDHISELDGQRINIAPDMDDTKPFEYIIDFVQENLGLTPTYELHPDADYLGPHILDNTKLTRLGWSPKIRLDEGLEKVKEILRKSNA
jgi:nucleoside-diphosphate-sugar epimerase